MWTEATKITLSMASAPPSPAEWVQEVKIVREAGKIIIHLYFFLTKLNDLHWGVSNTSKWLTEGPIYFLSDSYMLQCDEDCPVSAEQPLLAQSQHPWCTMCALPLRAALDHEFLTHVQKPFSSNVLLALTPLDIYQAFELATAQAVGAGFGLFCCCCCF